MIILKHGDHVYLEEWTGECADISVEVRTVRGCALDVGEDPDVEEQWICGQTWRGCDLAWTLQHNLVFFRNTKKAQQEGARMLADGQIVEIEGRVYTVKDKPETRSIMFIPSSKEKEKEKEKEMTVGLNDMIGQKVIIRTYSAGVFYGILTAKSGDEVYLSNARRMWFWKAVQSISLSACAIYGIDQKESRIVAPVEKIWLQAIEIIPCTPIAIESIEETSYA